MRLRYERGDRSLLRKPEEAAPWRPGTWRWWEAILVFIVGFVLGNLARAQLSPPGASPTAHVAGRALVEILWTLVLLLWLGALHPRWRDAMGWPTRARTEVHEGAVFGFILYGIVALGLALPLGRLLSRVPGEPVQGAERSPYALPAIGITAALVFALIIAPVA